MDYDREVHSLSAETLAFGALIAFSLNRIGRTNPALASAVSHAFDDAANYVENFAIKLGKSASPDHTVKALRIIEELRTAVVRDQGEPKDAI